MERHEVCTKQLDTVGWVAVLPEIWQSIFYHAELDLLLVVYVDDFKMAGPEANLAEGWKRISSVIDMDPPRPFGRYFGCHHFEKTGVRLPREAHPFAYVFDKKHAAAIQGNLEPPRTEVYWEVEPEVGAILKKLYLTVDIKLYPTLQPTRVTEPEDEEDSILDNPNQNPRGKKDKWWTGQTCSPLIEVDPEEFRMALAARKGPPKRSKAEAKRKAKQSKFHGTETIQEEPVPCMSKPVNVMTYAMRDFLVSCADKYCELAKVRRFSLKHLSTPFHENRIAKTRAANCQQGSDENFVCGKDG